MPLDIGIDLGTATVQVYIGGEIVISEPSVIALNTKTDKVVAVHYILSQPMLHR